jgi:Leucine-rich repeat (LRR) protein
MDRLNKNELFSLGIEMDLPTLIKFCSTNLKIKKKLCDEKDIWIYKLNKEFPEHKKLKMKNFQEKYKLLYSLNILKGKLENEGLEGEKKRDIYQLFQKGKINLSLWHVPREIGVLKNLKKLILSFQDGNIPKELGNLINLQILDLTNNNLEEIPEELSNLKNLNTIYLTKNKFREFPKALINLPNLETLILYDNEIRNFPKTQLHKLKTLFLSNNQIENIEEIKNLKNLKYLSLRHNNIKKIPKEIENLTNLLDLNLSQNQLEEIPKEIGNLYKLLDLNISENRLEKIPDEIGNLPSLEFLNLSYNNIKKIPKSFGNLLSLKYLNLQDNKLTKIPEEIGNLYNLLLFNISGNKEIRELPVSLKNCKYLRIDLSTQKIHIPEELETLRIVTNHGTYKIENIRQFNEQMDRLYK